VNSTDLLNYFRGEVNDLAQPPMWTDQEIFIWMDDAQREFCRRVQGLPDATTPEVVKVQAHAGQAFSKLHPSIMKIRMAQRADFNELLITNVSDLGTPVHRDYGTRPTSIRLDATQGPLETVVLGMEVDKCRWAPIPLADETVTLVVDRFPICEISKKGQEFEIQRQHHIRLFDWMAHRAYSKQDADTYDRTQADRYQAVFIQYCAEARSELERLRQKNRTVAYGGIPMGGITHSTRY
jgi:hypothetical protein